MRLGARQDALFNSPRPRFHRPQAYIARARIDSFSLTADMNYVSQNAGRIARALFEICLRRGWSGAAEVCLTMCKVGG